MLTSHLPFDQFVGAVLYQTAGGLRLAQATFRVRPQTHYDICCLQAIPVTHWDASNISVAKSRMRTMGLLN
jgi:hypothetical protein